jgi:hypothetical protein
MMIRHLAGVAAIVVIGGVAFVACSDDQQACAATIPASQAAEPMAPTSQASSKPGGTRPGSTRTTSKIQDKPGGTSTTRTTTGSGTTRTTTTIKPNWKSSTKPTTWDGYKQDRNWSQPYAKNKPVPQQPVIVHVYNHDYRTYPGYVGYYPVGVWPIGYGERYGCVAESESTPQPTENPSAAPATVTVTAPPPVTVTVPPSATPSETPR